MIKGFKEFVLRGNVIDLAVAFVIGVAFAAVVSAIVDNVINPVIASLFNAKSLDSLAVTIGGAHIGYGAVLGALIQFLLIALVVYFGLVVPINYVKRLAFKTKDAAESADTPPTELELLADIRDLLARTESGSNRRHAAEEL